MDVDGGWDAHTGNDGVADPDPGAVESAGISVSVDGVVHDYAATHDLDGDGVADTVHVDGGPDGHDYAYSDTTGDGVADTLTEYDQHGDVAARATFDADADGWRDAPGAPHDGTDGGTDPAAPDDMRAEPGAQPASVGVDTAPDATGAEPRPLVIDGPDGVSEAGPASYDTTGDGVADTAVSTTSDGTTVVATDVDGDGRAVYVTEVGRDGAYTSFEHTGGAEWTVVDQGTLGVGGSDAADPTDPQPLGAPRAGHGGPRA